MGKNVFSPGDAVAGLIVDGVKDTPYLTGTLTFEEGKGIRLTIPYLVGGGAQFEAVEGWVRDSRPPSNLELLTDSGSFTMHGCRVSASPAPMFGTGFSKAEVRPQEIVFKNRDGDFDDDLEVTELRSRVDGLTEWTAFGATTFSYETDEDHHPQKISVEVESKDPVEWRHGEVKFSLRNDWSTDQEHPGFRIREWVSLATTYDESRPCSEHLAEQRKVIALLALMYGSSIKFRRHDIRDSRFTLKTAGGQVLDVPFYELVSEETVDDLWLSVSEGLKNPLALFSHLDVGALERWMNSYDAWQRFILPAVATLQRPESYVEDHVLNASMSLEAAGHILGPVEGEAVTLNPYNGKPTTSTFVFRCLETVGLNWSEIAESRIHLARAIAGNYNTVKHYDRGALPPTPHTYVTGEVALLVVRLLALRLLDPSMTLVKAYAEDWKFRRFKEQIQAMNLYAGPDGKFGGPPSSGESSR